MVILEDCAVVKRDEGYDLEPFVFNLTYPLNGEPIPDWTISVPREHVELIIDKAEETEVILRLRRKLTPELREYRKTLGIEDK